MGKGNSQLIECYISTDLKQAKKILLEFLELKSKYLELNKFSYFIGFIFADLYHDEDIKFNGSEWTTMHYWDKIESF